MKKTLITLFIVSFMHSSFLLCEEIDSDKDTNKSRPFVLPVVMYSTDTGVGVGFAGVYGYSVPGSKTSTLETSAIYTQKKQFTFSVRWQHLFNNSKSRFYQMLNYQKYPSLFFGLGNDTKNEDPEKYTPESFVLKLYYERAVINRIKIRTQLSLGNHALVKAEPNGHIKNGDISWSSGRFDAGPGIAILWDSRDNYLATKTGTLAKLEYQGYMFQDDGGAFNTFSVDIRHFRNPLSELVFGSMFWIVDSGGDIPFYLLPSLGGDGRLRGYEYNRFFGEKLILVQQDIRFPIWGPIGGIVFAATGRVSNEFGDLFAEKYHMGYGTGLRYYIDKENNLCVRFDIAFGYDTNSTYITFAEAF